MKIVPTDEIKRWKHSKQIAALSKSGGKLDRTLRRFPRKTWDYTRDRKNWCIREILWHLADQEAHFYIWMRKAIAEPNGRISTHDQEIWSSKLGYKRSDPLQAKALLHFFRKANADLVERLPSKVWKNIVKHPEWGKVSLGDMVAIDIWHLDAHLAQMGRRYAEWKKH